MPGLRQVGRTGPYMHNGSLATLEDVVKHYSEVSPDRLHSDGMPLVRPLGLIAGGERRPRGLPALARCRDAAAAGAAAALSLERAFAVFLLDREASSFLPLLSAP